MQDATISTSCFTPACPYFCTNIQSLFTHLNIGLNLHKSQFYFQSVLIIVYTIEYLWKLNLHKPFRKTERVKCKPTFTSARDVTHRRNVVVGSLVTLLYIIFVRVVFVTVGAAQKGIIYSFFSEVGGIHRKTISYYYTCS